MQSEALVILLQETHCTDAEKLVLPNYQLAGSSLSRKHGLATFVHERLRYTHLDQSPLTLEIEWLCVDVDGYKIVNVYKPTPMHLRTLDLPVYPHPCLNAGDFNCRHADWGYDDNSPDGECLAGWASINCLALLYNAKDAASFYSGHWNTGTNPDLAFASVGPNSRLPDRRILDKFPRSQHRPSLITPPKGLLWQCQACLLSDGISARPIGVTTLLWRINSQRLCCRLIHLMWMRLTRTSITPLRKQPKRLSHAGIEITIFRVGMQSVNPSIKPFCSLLRETTRVWLLQLCLTSLTESRGIDGPKQFVKQFCKEVSDLWRATTPDAVNISDNFSQREFAAALQHLKPGKALGPDSICSELILHAGAALKSWLCDFLSSCLR